MVITKFIRGAREVEVDAVAKDGRVSQNRCVFLIKCKMLHCFYSYIIVIHLQPGIYPVFRYFPVKWQAGTDI